jgi:hypothetical protein
MKYVLVESITNQSGYFSLGTRYDAESANLLRSKGGVLLPCREEERNTLHRWSRVDYHLDDQKFGPNAVLKGPILYVEEPAHVYWAVRLLGKDPSGTMNVTASSTQVGKGLVRINPLDNDKVTIESKLEVHPDVPELALVSGVFKVNPLSAQTGFAAFDLYLAYPKGFKVLWFAMSQS